MRTKNSIKNITISILTQIVMIVLGFLSRKIFLESLGVKYLGVNGLMENVLAMLALVESGVGASIVYHLYKPLAENDKTRILALIQLYKKAYAVIALIVLIISIILFPFLGKFMKDNGSISNITIIYFLFVANNMTYYLNAHKVSLINADQKGYILARVNLGFQVVTKISKIIILLITKNYILYLLIELAIFIIQNLYNGKIVYNRYPFLKNSQKISIDKKEKESLIKNIKAIFLHNIGGYFVFGTDNLLISSFIGIATVGLYSNYTMIIAQLESLLSSVLGGIGASVGHLIAVENYDKRYSIFKVLNFATFWIYCICVVFLFNILEPFVNWWLGNGFLLNSNTFLLILINFYIMGLRSPILTYKMKGGIFVQDKYVPLIEAAINLGASLILVKYIGLVGIFLGTTISTIATVFWYAPYLVYKHIFNRSVYSYFISYFFYMTLTFFVCLITKHVCILLISGNSLLSLVERGFICITIPNIILLVLFYKSTEYQYIKNVLKGQFTRKKINSVNIQLIIVG